MSPPASSCRLSSSELPTGSWDTDPSSAQSRQPDWMPVVTMSLLLWGVESLWRQASVLGPPTRKVCSLPAQERVSSGGLGSSNPARSQERPDLRNGSWQLLVDEL